MNYVIKTKFKPNKILEDNLYRLSNISRFTYNWLLGYCLEKKKPKEARNVFRKLLRDKLLYDQKTGEIYEDAFLDSLRDSPSQITDMEADNLLQAFKTVKKSRVPSFKSKLKSDLSFTINKKNDSNFKLDNNILKVVKVGSIGLELNKLRFPLNETNIKRITITNKAYGWYISILIEIDDEILLIKDSNTNSIGIDWGISKFATDSDGNYCSFKEETNYSKYLKLSEQLKYLQSVLGMKRHRNKEWKISKKYKLLKYKIKSIYEKLSNIRNNFLHKVSKDYIENYGTIVIENLKPANMLKNHKLARAISESMFYTWKVMLTYKAKMYGRQLILINPRNTSQTCSKCGTVKTEENKLKLSNKVFKCECGLELDRDYNAALNILKLA